MRALPIALASLLAGAGSARAANLELIGVEASPAAVAGGALHVDAIVQLRGTNAPFSLGVYLTAGGVLTGAPRVGEIRWTPISVIGRERVIGDVTLPSTVSGLWRVAVIADDPSAIAETNELDNAIVAEGVTRVRAALPDVSIRSVRLETTAGRIGDAATISVTASNGGEVEASVELVAHLSRNDAVSPTDPVLGRRSVTLAPGSTQQISIAGAVPAGTLPGDYQVGVLADAAFGLGEALEGNNEAIAPATFNVWTETLALDTASLPGGTVFLPYFEQLNASGGDGHYRFVLAGGRLPVGLTLDGTKGTISGTPSQSGTFTVDLAVESARSRDSKRYTMEVAVSGRDLKIVVPELFDATLARPYDTSLVVSGGEPPYTWSVFGQDPIPPGFDLRSDGFLSGLPTKQGTFTFNVQVQDALGARDAATFTLVVKAATVIVHSEIVPPVPVGQELDHALSAEGGRPPYSWEALSTPPPGLTLTEDGHLRGTPSQVGDFSFRVRAEDATGAHTKDTGLIHVKVEESGAFEIATHALPSSVIRERFIGRLQATGGVEPLRWSLVPGDGLPQGYYLKAGDPFGFPSRDAVIEGTSARALQHAFAVQVEDAEGRRREVVLAIEVIRPESLDSASCACVAPSSASHASGLAGLALLAGLAVIVRRRRR